MNKLTKLRIELAKAMAKFSEFQTDKGMVYSEGDWVSTSTPLYIFDENSGELLPAADGAYESPERTSTYKYKEIWTVVNGIVTAVESISTSEETTNETPVAETEPIEEVVVEIKPIEEVVVEQSEQVVEEVVNEEEIKFNKVYDMINTLVNEISTLKSDVDALNITMTNAKLGQQSVVIKDAAVNKSKELHPIWSVK